MVVVACIGAVASWIVGALNFVLTLRVLSGESNRKQMWSRRGRLAVRLAADDRAKPRVYSSKVNKALVAFFTCLMIAAAAMSLATNLSRLSR